MARRQSKPKIAHQMVPDSLDARTNPTGGLMKLTEILGEFLAGLCLFAFLFGLLVFGSAVIPYESGMHSEIAYLGVGQ